MKEPPTPDAGPGDDEAHAVEAFNPARTATRQRGLILRMVRLSFVVLILTVTLLNILIFGKEVTPGLTFDVATYWWVTLIGSISLAAIFLAIDLLTPNKKLQTFGGVIFGLIAGLIVTVAFGFVIDLVATSWEFAQNAEIVNTIKVLLGICLCYLGISSVLQTQDDFRLVIPYVEFAKQIRGQRPMLLDSSVLIDARIVDVGETGFIQAPIVIPFFVVNELQTLADSSDKLKRAKGRRGLDVIARLQRSAKLDVSIDETAVPGKAVDQMLVELAREMSGLIVTGDLALARIAGFRNIPVLNVNDLANALKPAMVPGDTLAIHLLKPGEQPGQAVGYLEDGTMVVAEDGAEAIGDDVTLTVRSTLQTSAGRMIFGRIGRATALDDSSAPGDTDGQAEPAGEPKPDGEPAPPRPGPFPPNPPKRSKRPRSPRR
ncbi:MAG: PIN/TRAM domain-containing protein [Phycisphaeraceae bacterium]|nr:MAG: PIN/TRAM domain-containing protein [Phycisphaeraceae bacterium]